MRPWEIQAAGTLPLDEWYKRPLQERTVKVAALFVPSIQAALAHYETPISVGK
jgi:hypothetical protein